MREGRLRRLVVPDWPPKSVSEALLLVLCAVGARILLDLWLPREQVIPLFSAPADQALVLLGELLRWSVVVLVFGLAARLALRVEPSAALGIGAGVLLAFCLEPVLVLFRPDLTLYQVVAGLALAAALVALALGWITTRRLRPSLVFMLAIGVLAAMALTYMQRHAWLLDLAGMAVKGALIADRDEARRVFLLHLPPLIVISGLWLILGGATARKLWYVVQREWPWPVFGFVALGVIGGWMAAARAESLSLEAWLPSLFLPPAVYGLFAVIMALALVGVLGASVQGHLRQRTSTIAVPDLAAMAVIVVVLSLAISPGVMAAVAAFAMVLLALIWPAGPARPPMVLELAGGGALAAAAFCAGALALPEFDVERFRGMAPLLAAVAGGGIALAGLARIVDESVGRRPAQTRRPRLVAAMWLVDFGTALAIVAALMGIGDPLLWAVIVLGGLGFLALLAYDRNFERGVQVLAL
ncbi:MAG: hypothetical protein HOK83_00055, partial [Rhodospirillaceae bacterium]|nr:hypothetical protein [Rhodospirillaceae bacterium]